MSKMWQKAWGMHLFVRVTVRVMIAHGIPASILLILGIGTGAVQGRYHKTRFGAGFSIGNWVLFID